MKVSRGFINRQREDRTQPYYDRQMLRTLLTWNADTTFFAGVQNHPAIGNMTVAGQLPAPKEFVVRQITVKPYVIVDGTGVPATAGLALPDSLYLEFYGGMVFYIADKEYLRMPLWMAPSGGGMFNPLLGPSQNGEPLAFNKYKLNIPLLIPMQQNFRIVVPAPATACPIWTGGANHVEITIGLHGDERRAVQ